MLIVNKTFIAFLLLTLSISSHSRNFEHILERWKNPSSTDIFVVAHRAAFMEGGQIIFPENSIASIEYAVMLDLDMVELDVRATKDNHFIIMHDETIDRTTNGSGKVEALTLEELKTYFLINEVNGELTAYKVPTLTEIYALVKNRIMVNLDPKLPVTELGRALQMAKDVGVDSHIVLKGTADNDEQLEDIKQMLSRLPFKANFMPMHWDKNLDTLDPVYKSFAVLRPDAAEMIVNIGHGDKRLVDDGGILFSREARKLARRNSVHLWINTLYIDPLRNQKSDMDWLMWNGGRHDIMGLKYPDKVFQFWVNQGATIIQTDEPKFLITYLKRKGLRQ